MYFRMMQFSDIYISQGSVATCLKRGGIFKHEFVANLLLSLLVKKFENQIGEVMAKSLVSCFFLTHGEVLYWEPRFMSFENVSIFHDEKRCTDSGLQPPHLDYQCSTSTIAQSYSYSVMMYLFVVLLLCSHECVDNVV